MKNATEYSPETPIAVRKHYRSGGPNYLTPRQRAVLAGQQALFEGVDEMDREFLRGLGRLNPQQNELQDAYESGASKAVLKKALRATGMDLDVVNEMIRKLKPKKQNSRRNPRRNHVNEVFEMFQGRPVTGEFDAIAPDGTPDELAELGRLIWLELRTPTDEYITIDFDTPNNQSPTLCADVRGNLHIVGGTYRMVEAANSTLGSINRIAYETHKTHIGDGKTYEFVHEFSEESGGEQPKLQVDNDGLFKIFGGVYTLSSAGIVD